MTEFGTTAECVLAARNGDREAFGELVRRYRDMAGATAMAVISNRQDAEDAVQEAFIRAYTALGRLQTPEAFGSWLRTAVRRIATDQLRRRYRRSFVENAEGALDILDANSGEDANHDLRDAVNQLPERQREAVLTYYANGFTYERAAEYLGIPMSTLKGRLRQARLRLRRELDPSGLEDMTMGSEKVEKKVSDAVARISTENIETTIPLDVTRNIVFFAGVACDVEVCQTDGDSVVVTGTKSCTALTDDDASETLADIRIEADAVADYLNAGPHEGEICVGNNYDSIEDRHGPSTTSNSQVWREYGRLALSKQSAFPASAHFPEVVPRDHGLRNALLAALKSATRITLTQDTVDYVVIPHDEYSSELDRGFAKIYTGEKSPKTRTAGARGRANLVIAVPKGATVTFTGMLSIKSLSVNGMTGDVHFINCGGAEIAELDGTARLFNTRLEKASGIRGDLVQVTYLSFQGGNWDPPGQVHRSGDVPSVIQDVTGSVLLDLAKINLELSNIHGSIDVRNRWGTTRFDLNEHQIGDRYRLESDSGEVRAYIRESLLEEIGVAVSTLHGDLAYDALRDHEQGSHNSWTAMSVATVNVEHMYIDQGRTDYTSDLVITTRDGNIIVEKTK